MKMKSETIAVAMTFAAFASPEVMIGFYRLSKSPISGKI